MTTQTLIFLISVSLTTLALSYFTAFVYTKTIKMNQKLAYTVRVLGFLFPFLFIFANALSRSSNLEFVKYIYSAMSIGAGLAFYFLVGAILISLAYVVFKIIRKPLPSFIPIGAFIISCFISIFAFVQARDLKVVSYVLEKDNLPDSLVDKKIILVSDTHYGLVNHKKAAKRLVNKIMDQNGDVVFLAGDFFDGPDISTEEIENIWRKLSEKTPVYYIPGNHEEYGNYEKFLDSAEKSGFIVLEDSISVYENISVAGIVYRSKDEIDEALPVLKNFENNLSDFSILLNHAPIFYEEVERLGFDLMFSGHTHRGQFWPLRYITYAIYGKYHYGLNDFKNLSVITTSGVGTSGPPIRLLNTPEIVEIRFR